MHLYYADIIANNIKDMLAPYCEVINIAGSIRRRLAEVKDIELVLIPMKSKKVEKNLFDEVISENEIIHPDFERTVRNLGKIVKGKFLGRMMQVEVKQTIESIEHTIMLDMFMPQKHDYYRQFAIRTGSSDYSYKYIACSWRKKGWVGTDEGLRLQKQCYQVTDSKWALKQEVGNPVLPPVWQNEQEFFRWLGVQYLNPEHRNL